MAYINHILGERLNFLSSVLKTNKDMYFIIDATDSIDDSGNFSLEAVLCHIFNHIHLRLDIEHKCTYINNESALRTEINDIYFSLCKDLLLDAKGSRFFQAKEINISIGP